jgi:hypothetical protein
MSVETVASHSLTFTTAKSCLLAGKLQSISAAIQSTLACFQNCKIPLVGRKVTIDQRSNPIHTCLLSELQNPACWQESYNQSAHQSDPHMLAFTTAKSRLLAGKLQSISAAIQSTLACFHNCKIPLVGRKVTIDQRSNPIHTGLLSQLQNPACWQESYNRSVQQVRNGESDNTVAMGAERTMKFRNVVFA